MRYQAGAEGRAHRRRGEKEPEPPRFYHLPRRQPLLGGSGGLGRALHGRQYKKPAYNGGGKDGQPGQQIRKVPAGEAIIREASPPRSRLLAP